MQQTPPVIQAIMDHKDHNELSRMIGRSKKFLWTVQRKWQDPKYKMYTSTLDELYSYFRLPKDEYYRQMITKKNSSDSVLGTLFRNRRIELGFTREQIAEKIRGTTREIERIELGFHLPAMNSWYVCKLLELYNFDKEDEEIIRWYIVIFKDIKKITKKYEIGKCRGEVMDDE